MSDDPWRALSIPLDGTSVCARRVSETGKWDFFWGRDSDGRCLLVLRHGVASAPAGRLPHLKGVEVYIPGIGTEDSSSLIIRLLETGLRDIFQRLCIDIVASASRARTEPEAVAISVARTWRWHHLLRGGGEGKLTADEQKGLIGELLVLEHYLLPTLAATEAVAGWRGPLGEPKDFLVGRLGIEAKARGTATASHVRVSSEYQLDDEGLEKLFLHLSVFDPVTHGEEGGFTLSEVACRIRDRLAEDDIVAVQKYDALLAAAGFRYEDDYAGAGWRGGERGIYLVSSSFPRLTPAGLPPGVSDVKYTLHLSGYEQFLVAAEVLIAAVSGGSHGK